MNVLARELQSCLSQLTAGDDGEYSSTFHFPPEFSGFKGHFPGNPVLPGVCMVQAVLVMMAAQKHTPVVLKRIVSAKWLVPVKPGAELHFVCRERRDESIETTVRVRVTCGTEKVADLNLMVICETDRKDAPA